MVRYSFIIIALIAISPYFIFKCYPYIMLRAFFSVLNCYHSFKLQPNQYNTFTVDNPPPPNATLPSLSLFSLEVLLDRSFSPRRMEIDIQRLRDDLDAFILPPLDNVIIEKLSFSYESRDKEVLATNVENVPMNLSKDDRITIQLDLIKPPQPKNKLFIYYHGGAYVSGSCKVFIRVITAIALRTGWQGLCVDYRLHPEATFPASVYDSVASYLYAINELKFKPENIALVGESAGGGMIALAILDAREHGHPLPGMGIMLHPYVDQNTISGGSMDSNEQSDCMLTPKVAREIKKILSMGRDSKLPMFSPTFANLQGFPRLFIQVGKRELLHDQVVSFASKAKSSEVNVTLLVSPFVPHGGHVLFEFVPESNLLLNQICNYMNDQPLPY